MTQSNKGQETNVIPFPNVRERLLEKGYEELNAKKFHEAYETFELMTQYGVHNEDTELAAVVCLMEFGKLEAAKERCERIVWGESEKGFEALEIYLSILIQLGLFEEVEWTIERARKENGISPEHAEKLKGVLSVSQKMTKDLPIHQESSLHKIEHDLLSEKEVAKQITLVQSLSGLNLTKLFPTFQVLLLDKGNHPAFKTAILQLLMREEIPFHLKIEKFGREMDVTLDVLHQGESEDFSNEVLKLLSDTLEHENPSFYEMLKEYWAYQLYSLFPFVPEPAEENAWAAAIHGRGMLLYGMDQGEDLSSLYNVTNKAIEEVEFFLARVEQESSLLL